MTDHVTQWLEAYHDGELHGTRRDQVEAHLAECTECQAELEALRSLSARLHEDFAAFEFTPAERFSAELASRLPEQPPRRLGAAWWLMPLALLGAWLFLVITLWLSTALQITASVALPAGELSWLGAGSLKASTQMGWFAITTRLFGTLLGEPGWQVLALVNEVNVFVARLSRVILLQVLLATAYLGWLAAWWLRRGHLVANPETASSLRSSQ